MGKSLCWREMEESREVERQVRSQMKEREREDWEEGSLGGTPVPWTTVDRSLSKAVGESLSSSWRTKKSFVFLG